MNHCGSDYNAASEFSRSGAKLGFCMSNRIPGLGASSSPQNVLHNTTLSLTSQACPVYDFTQWQLHPLGIHSFSPHWTMSSLGAENLCFLHYFDLAVQHHAWQKRPEGIFLNIEKKKPSISNYKAKTLITYCKKIFINVPLLSQVVLYLVVIPRSPNNVTKGALQCQWV